MSPAKDGPSPQSGSRMRVTLKFGLPNNKRKPSSSPSDSSVSDSEDGGEEDNSDSIEEDDEEEPAAFVPSRGRKRGKGHGAGRTGGRITHKDKRLKLALDDDDSDEFSSISSVNSVSAADTSSLDSDDEYEAVNYVSDDEDDVEKLEEELILQSEDERVLDVPAPDEWLGLDELENRPLYTAGSFFEDDQFFLQSMADNLMSDSIDAIEEIPIIRRVHFEDSDDSSDSDKSTEDELVSDFLHQDALDPDLRRMIENDVDPVVRRHTPHELFVNQDVYDLPGNIYHVDTDTSTVVSSSGYESDGGETTEDEDYPPPATISHPRSILRRDSSESLPPLSGETNQRSQPLRRRGPFRGTFVADPHKPVAVVAPNGTQLIVIPPYATARHDWLQSATNSLANTAYNSPRATTLNVIDDSDTDALLSPVQPDLSPMLSSSANVMITALGNDLGGQVMGPPEAFYPSNRLGTTMSLEGDDDDDSEGVLNVDDFIDFGNGSSDEDEKEFDEADALVSPIAASSIPGSLTTTPSRNADISQNNNAEMFLNHLDRGIVTAFRRNHSRYHALIRLPQHREFVPANSPSRPASVFKRSKFTDPRTPTRKHEGNLYSSGEAVRRKLMDSHRRSKVSF
ncbi:hypothetical protein AJ80_08047 [Polytolypa hystricis UAMH7299]|uniref:Uncharacterized protein n=1 Tax=Polytolypa hystricis (strain UAMH7299) TaxID=1447883 RepID=A0A2B7XDX4_POLH7|nr:hypothetical protein AJ80_08047 [Polytolypa hystricis UAMH7299]